MHTSDQMQRLPTEILVMTFKKAIQCSAPGDHYTSLTCFMLVCRRWRDTLIGDTTLWSLITISGRESVPHALRSVNRSGCSRLTVDLVWSLSTPPDDIHPLLEQLADRSHRLASFKLATRYFPPLPQWASLAANLHTLVLRNGGSSQTLNNFINGPLPRLRYLVLEGFRSWPAGRFCNLHQVTLKVPHDHGTVSSAALLDLLNASPELRGFNISGCKRVPSLPPSSKAVALPHLTLLNIHASSVHDILCHMSLPSTVEIRFTKCINAIGVLLERASLSHLGDSLTALSTLAVALDTDHSIIVLRSFAHGRTSPSLVVAEELPPGSKTAAVKILEDYAILPAFSSVEELIVIANASFRLRWKAWLSNFPALQRLTIRTCNPDAFYTAIRRELGFNPTLYPTPRSSSASSTRSIHIDWRATSSLIRYYLTFEDISSMPLRRKGHGIVSRMKPRGVV